MSARATVTVFVDDEPLEAPPDIPLGALLHSRYGSWRRARDGAARGLFCAMGVCFDCVVHIEGRGRVRACIEPVRDGMRVRRG